MSDRKYIAVLMGGVSPEREISFQSGEAVADALAKTDSNVTRIIVNDEEVEELDSDKIDVAFIALHGYFGEDGGIQQILESRGIPYTGSGVSASRLAMNKAASKDIFRQNNLPTPEYLEVSTSQNISDIVTRVKNLKLPVVTKPVSSGSSIGLSIVKEYAGLRAAIEYASRYSEKILIEEFIDGRELAVGILNDKALPIIEIKTAMGLYDYDAKYKSKNTRYIILESADESSENALSDAVYNRAQRLALQAHKSLGCHTFSRVDMIVNRDEEAYILEVNTIPGFTERSLLPKAAAAAGISFTELCNTIVRAASRHSYSPQQSIRTGDKDTEAVVARIST